MNRIYSNCDKINSKLNYQIGQAGSIADFKERLTVCFDCYSFIDCKESQDYLKGIIAQQENIINLKNK